MMSAFQRLNSSVGYLAAWPNTGPGLAKTKDNGVTWQRLSIPVTYLMALRFMDEQVGWAAGFSTQHYGTACPKPAPSGAPPCQVVVLRTQDGGETWQPSLQVPTDASAVFEQLQAADGQHAWVLTADSQPCTSVCQSALRRTVDGGRTWVSLIHGPIAAIRFASATRGWMALDGTPSTGTVEVRATNDGGSTWTQVFRTTTGGAYGLDAATVNTVWLLTRDGAYCSASDCQKYALFRSDNGGATWFSQGNPKDFATRCSGGHLAGPLFASVSRGWLGLTLGAGGASVGSGGILRSEDGGWTWRCTTSPANIQLVIAGDPLHAWAAGEDRTNQSTALYTTEDGGASWRPVDLNSLR